MKIGIGCDHAGYLAKEELKSYLIEKGYEVKDYGTFSQDSCDYPDYAYPVAKSVANGENAFGILVCGTGIGIGLVANKVRGIRCATCSDNFSTEMTRRHNDANMISFGARVISTEKMKELVDVFLTTPFEGGKHQRRVNKIKFVEDGFAPDGSTAD